LCENLDQIYKQKRISNEEYDDFIIQIEKIFSLLLNLNGVPYIGSNIFNFSSFKLGKIVYVIAKDLYFEYFWKLINNLFIEIKSCNT